MHAESEGVRVELRAQPLDVGDPERVRAWIDEATGEVRAAEARPAHRRAALATAGDYRTTAARLGVSGVVY